ncbi:MAG TPA: DUF4339 domain-containing protein [Pirellulales bacterium]|nr:DUF4339 domain-containing protein [Pirellulales bacterium]
MEEDWYCKAMGMEFGPMALEDLAQLVERGNIRGNHQVRQGTDGAWIKAADVPELLKHLTAAPHAPGNSAEPAETVRGETSPPVAMAEPARAGAPTSFHESSAVLLDRYYGAVLLGPDGISVCDLRSCQPVTLPGARIVDHRSAHDDTPLRLGALELRVSIRDVDDGATTTTEERSASVQELPSSEAGTDGAAVPSIDDDSEKPVARRLPPPTDANANTRDVAAETLRRMFTPRPSKTR